MENLCFTIWMLGYPMVTELSEYLNNKVIKLLKEQDDEKMTEEYFSRFMYMIIWFVVGFFLYRK